MLIYDSACFCRWFPVIFFLNCNLRVVILVMSNWECDKLIDFLYRIGFMGLTILNWVVVSKICYVHPYLEKIPIVTNIFQMGWNHQLVISRCSWMWVFSNWYLGLWPWLDVALWIYDKIIVYNDSDGPKHWLDVPWLDDIGQVSCRLWGLVQARK